MIDLWNVFWQTKRDAASLTMVWWVLLDGEDPELWSSSHCVTVRGLPVAGLRGDKEGEQRGCSGGSGSNTFLVQKVVGCFVHREFRTITKLAEIGMLFSITVC